MNPKSYFFFAGSPYTTPYTEIEKEGLFDVKPEKTSEIS